MLLTAVRVTCEVRSSSPGLVRAFFAKLKFHKLLFRAERMVGRDGHLREALPLDRVQALFQQARGSARGG